MQLTSRAKKSSFSGLLLVFQHVPKSVWPHKSHHMGRSFQASSAAKANLEGMAVRRWGGCLPGCWVRAFFCLRGCLNRPRHHHHPTVWESYAVSPWKWRVNFMKWFSVFCSFHTESGGIITRFPIFVHCYKPCQVFRFVICDSATSSGSFTASE